MIEYENDSQPDWNLEPPPNFQPPVQVNAGQCVKCSGTGWRSWKRTVNGEEYAMSTLCSCRPVPEGVAR